MAQEPDGRIASIQLLRALAALTVAAGHIAFAFAEHIGSGLGLVPTDGAAGQIAVMLFFIVSGYVMVVSSKPLFGRPGARRAFWTRRLIRIMPPYWIATGLLVLIFLTLFPQPVDPLKLAQSLMLVPYWPEGGFLRPLPVLWVGWTLFYEMLFYALFGLMIGWRRDVAVAGVVAVLGVAAVAGFWVPPVSAPLYAATRPVILIFAAGMVLALWRDRGSRAPGWLRWAALLAAIAVTALAPTPDNVGMMGLDYVLWAAVPALLIAFAALAGPLALPATGLVNRAGDASYAIYLLHVPLAWFWLWLWGRLPFFDPGAWDYLVSALAATCVAGWLFFVLVERPLTAALNRLARSPHGDQTSA